MSWDLKDDEELELERAAWSSAKQLCLLWFISVWCQDVHVNPVIAKMDPSLLNTFFNWVIVFLLHSHQCSPNEGWYSSCFTTLSFPVLISMQGSGSGWLLATGVPPLLCMFINRFFLFYFLIAEEPCGSALVVPSSFFFALTSECARGLFSD